MYQSFGCYDDNCPKYRCMPQYWQFIYVLGIVLFITDNNFETPCIELPRKRGNWSEIPDFLFKLLPPFYFMTYSHLLIFLSSFLFVQKSVLLYIRCITSITFFQWYFERDRTFVCAYVEFIGDFLFSCPWEINNYVRVKTKKRHIFLRWLL